MLVIIMYYDNVDHYTLMIIQVGGSAILMLIYCFMMGDSFIIWCIG